MYSGIPIPHGALFIKKDVLLELGMYNLSYQINADYDIILQLIKNDMRGFYVGFPLAQYRDGGTSSGFKTFMERRKLLKNHGVSFFYRNSIVWLANLKLTLFKFLPGSVVLFFKKIYSLFKLDK